MEREFASPRDNKTPTAQLTTIQPAGLSAVIWDDQLRDESLIRRQLLGRWIRGLQEAPPETSAGGLNAESASSNPPPEITETGDLLSRLRWGRDRWL